MQQFIDDLNPFLIKKYIDYYDKHDRDPSLSD